MARYTVCICAHVQVEFNHSGMLEDPNFNLKTPFSWGWSHQPYSVHVPLDGYILVRQYKGAVPCFSDCLFSEASTLVKVDMIPLKHKIWTS